MWPSRSKDGCDDRGYAAHKNGAALEGTGVRAGFAVGGLQQSGFNLAALRKSGRAHRALCPAMRVQPAGGKRRGDWTRAGVDTHAQKWPGARAGSRSLEPSERQETAEGALVGLLGLAWSLGRFP